MSLHIMLEDVHSGIDGTVECNGRILKCHVLQALGGDSVILISQGIAPGGLEIDIAIAGETKLVELMQVP